MPICLLAMKNTSITHSNKSYFKFYSFMLCLFLHLFLCHLSNQKQDCQIQTQKAYETIDLWRLSNNCCDQAILISKVYRKKRAPSFGRLVVSFKISRLDLTIYTEVNHLQRNNLYIGTTILLWQTYCCDSSHLQFSKEKTPLRCTAIIQLSTV